jgi:hypothetical protein
MSKEKLEQLKEAAKPLLIYLNENHNPLTKVMVTQTSVEVMDGTMIVPWIFDYMKK